jgi:glycosyltransferase involved in cell wall biosynthesis
MVKDATDLADKMRRLIELSDEQLIALGRNSRLKVESQFDEEIVFKKYFKVLGLNYTH